jgi:hypothetical protein
MFDLGADIPNAMWDKACQGFLGIRVCKTLH